LDRHGDPRRLSPGLCSYDPLTCKERGYVRTLIEDPVAVGDSAHVHTDPGPGGCSRSIAVPVVGLIGLDRCGYSEYTFVIRIGGFLVDSRS